MRSRVGRPLNALLPIRQERTQQTRPPRGVLTCTCQKRQGPQEASREEHVDVDDFVPGETLSCQRSKELNVCADPASDLFFNSRRKRRAGRTRLVHLTCAVSLCDPAGTASRADNCITAAEFLVLLQLSHFPLWEFNSDAAHCYVRGITKSCEPSSHARS
jgi:hypothetical protein